MLGETLGEVLGEEIGEALGIPESLEGCLVKRWDTGLGPSLAKSLVQNWAMC